MTNQIKMYVSNAADEVLYCLNGVRHDTVSYTENLLQFDTLSFEVDKCIDVGGAEVVSTGYGALKEMMYIYVSGLDNDDSSDPATLLYKRRGRFRISEVEIENDGFNEKKVVSCDSCECELNNQNLVGIEINTGSVSSAEYIADGNVDDATGLAKEYVLFYNPNNPRLSLLNLIIEEVPYWSVGYVDPQLRNKKFSFEIDGEPIYSFMMNTLASTARCIFTFDTVNRTINAYSIERVDEICDTNIFVGYRNLLNTTKITKSNLDLYTRFNVEGKDGLSIASVNFNESHLENLLHLLNDIDEDGNPIYANSDIRKKYQTWYDYRYGDSGKRAEFTEVAKQYNQTLIDISDLQNRVPADAIDYNQYDGFSVDDLNSLLNQYASIVNVMISDFAEKDADGNLVTSEDGLAIIEDEAGLKNSIYWEDYKLYTQVLIPNLKIAIANKGVPDDDKTDYIDSFETDWDLYGVTELQGKLDSYQQAMNVFTEKGYDRDWADIPDEERSKWEEITYKLYHGLYVKNKNQYDCAYIALSGADGSGTVMYKDEDGYYLQRTNGTQYYFDEDWNLIEISPKRNGNKLVGRAAELESKQSEQAELVSRRDALMRDVAIENEKFGFTEEELNTIYRLRKDSDYQNENILITSLDNVVTQLDAMEELFQAAASELDIEAQPQYSIDATLDNLFNIQAFADYKGDFTTGNFIRVILSDGGYKTTAVELLDSNGNQLLSPDGTPIYVSQYVRDSCTMVKLRITSITRNPCLDDVNELTITFSNLVQSQNGLSDYTNLFNSAVTSAANKITANYAKSIDASQIMLTDGVLKAIANSPAVYNSVSQLITDTLTAKDGVFDTVSSNYISTEEFEARLARIQELHADSAFVKYLEAGFATVENLNAAKANIQTLNADNANIKNLLAGNAGVGDLQAIHISSKNVVISDATITDAMIAGLSAGKINAGTIYTSLVKIASDQNENLLIDGSTIQIKDTDATVRVQIGKDRNGDYNLALWDKSGNLLWDASGLYAAGMHDGIIKDVAVADDADIAAKKLNIPSIVTAINENGDLVVSSGQIIMDESGQTLSADFKTVTTNVATAQSTADSAVTAAGNAQSAADAAEKHTQTVETELDVVQGQISSKIWQTDIDSAVDDLDGKIDTVSDQYSTLDQAVSGIKTEVGKMQTAINEKADGSTVSTLETRVSTAEQDLSGFKTTVSSTYQTKTDAATDLSTAKSYADDVGTSALTDAKKYTDDQLVSYVTKSKFSEFEQSVDGFKTTVSSTYQTITAANEDLAEAKGYADDVGSSTLTTANTYADGVGTSATQSANTYTDNKLKSYVTTSKFSEFEQSVDGFKTSVSETYSTKKETSDNLASAKKYADDVGDSTLSDANSHADSVAGTAESNAKKYTNDQLVNYVTESKFSEFEQSVDGFKTTVSNTYETKTEANENLKSAKSYADGVGNSTLSDANSYADGVGKSTLTNANTYADGIGSTAESNANKYTDNQLKSYVTTSAFSEFEQNVDGFKTTVAKTYQTIESANENLSTAKSYADGVGSTAESNAKTYADGVGSSTLSNANSHADTVAGTAQKNATDYTDNQLKSYVTQTAFSKFEQDVNGFKTVVSETYQTITDAADDLSKAKSYADGVGSTAESNAKTYADGVGSTAESNANTYTDNKLTNYVLDSQFSEFKQTVNDFTLTVSSTYETKEDAEKTAEEIRSTIKQTSSEITSIVEEKYDSLANKPFITKKLLAPDGLEILDANGYPIYFDVSLADMDFNEYTSGVYSMIQQNADQIALRVTAGDVNSLIEQKADSIRLQASKISWTSDNSSLTEDGVLWAQGVDVTGSITADSGKIGKYDITSTYLMTGSGSTATGIGGDQAFWAGNSESNSAPFRVSYNGKLVATNAEISGEITATSGSIAGSLVTSGIDAENITVNKLKATQIDIDSLFADTIKAKVIDILNGTYYTEDETYDPDETFASEGFGRIRLVTYTDSRGNTAYKIAIECGTSYDSDDESYGSTRFVFDSTKGLTIETGGYTAEGATVGLTCDAVDCANLDVRDAMNCEEGHVTKLYASKLNGRDVPELESGRVTVTAAAATAGSVHIDFGMEFTSTPAITVTPHASAPQNVHLGVANTSKTGFDLTFWRSTAGTFTVSWIACNIS